MPVSKARRTRKQRGAGGKFLGMFSSNKNNKKKNTPPPSGPGAGAGPTPPQQQQPPPVQYGPGSYPAGQFPYGFFVDPAYQAQFGYGYAVYPPPTAENPTPQPVYNPAGSYPPGFLPPTYFPYGFVAPANGFYSYAPPVAPATGTPSTPDAADTPSAAAAADAPPLSDEELERIRKIVQAEKEKHNKASAAMATWADEIKQDNKIRAKNLRERTRERHRRTELDFAKAIGKSKENVLAKLNAENAARQKQINDYIQKEEEKLVKNRNFTRKFRFAGLSGEELEKAIQEYEQEKREQARNYAEAVFGY